MSMFGRQSPALLQTQVGKAIGMPPTAAEVTQIIEEGTRRLEDGIDLPVGYVPADLNSMLLRKMLGTERQPLCQELLVALEEHESQPSNDAAHACLFGYLAVALKECLRHREAEAREYNLVMTHTWFKNQ
jgi:hypothetical protein